MNELQTLNQISDGIHVIGFVLIVMVLSGILQMWLDRKGRNDD